MNNMRSQDESVFVKGFAGSGTTDELTNHNYDGIQEYDNPLPGWWKWLFIGTIVFAVPYTMYWHGSEGVSLAEMYNEEVADLARMQFAEIGELKGDEATLVKYMQDPDWVAFGASVFKTNCVSCHGATGGGKIGPNLCDDAFLHINKIEDVYKVIDEGAAKGAMPAWRTRLGQNERVLVSAYVASLRGKSPGGDAKGPQGKEIPAWPTEAASEAPATPEPAAN